MKTNNDNADTYSWNDIDSFSGNLSSMRPALHAILDKMISVASQATFFYTFMFR